MSSRVSVSYKEAAVNIYAYGVPGVRIARAQSCNVSVNLPATEVQELGSDKMVGRIFDLPEVTVALSTIDVGARNAFAMAGIDWAAAPSGTYISASDIKYVCIGQAFRAQGTSREVARTLYVPGAKLDSLSLNYSVGGDGTEEYNFQALDRRFLRYDVAVAEGVVASNQIALTNALALRNGSYVLSAFASGIGYLPQDSITASTSSSVTFDATAVPNGTPVLVTYHADLTDQWVNTYEVAHVAPDYTPAPDQPVGMRGYNVEIYLVKPVVSGTASRVLRAQTCNVQAQFPTTKINELGSEQAVGYSDQNPTVTGTLDILTHDFSLAAKFSGDDDQTRNDWVAEELNSGGWGLEVRCWRRGADRANGSPEKTVFIPRLEITANNETAQVGQDATQSFSIASKDGRVYMFKGRRPASFIG